MIGRGGLTRRRPDQVYSPPPGTAIGPGAKQVVRARTVIIQGAGGGEFVYDASGNLRSANVGATTTDPLQGITCQQGFSTFNGHGAVLDLLSTAQGVFFQYLDTGTATQGALITSSGASAAGTDPVTSTGYPAGFQGINPAFGSFTQLLGSAIVFGVAALFSRNAQVGVAGGSGASPPYLETDSPEQTTASHMALRLQGASPDGTVPAQALFAIVSGAGAITRVTNAAVEVQGQIASRFGGSTFLGSGEAIFPGTAGQSINSLSDILLTGASAPVVAGRYRVYGTVTGLNGGVAATQAVGLSTTAGVSAWDVDVDIRSATANTYKSFGRLTASGGRVGTGSLAANEVFVATYRGLITFSGSGNLNLTGSCVTLAADTWSVNVPGTELAVCQR